MTNRYSLLLFYSVISYTISAQSLINGHITDSQRQPVPYAIVKLYKDSSFIKGTNADSLGFYKLYDVPEGIYHLQVNYLGGNTDVPSFKATKDTTINVSITQSLNLDEVVVKGHKPVIRREIDRLVFNVDNSPLVQGNSLMDLLSQTPLVKVTDEAISIVGKSNVKIMFNGKPSYLDSADLIAYLKTLQSDDVARIEVITTPPAKYDAEGNGGLINIITKKQRGAGWQGSIGTSYTQRSFAGISSNVSVNYSSAKTRFCVKLRQSTSKGKISEDYDIIGNTNSQNSISRRNDTYKNAGVNVAFEHDFTPSSSVGIIYDFNKGKDNIDIDNQYGYYSSGKQDSLLTTKSFQVGNSQMHTLNLYYDLKLDSLGKKLGLLANYMHYTPDKEVNFTTINREIGSSDIVREPNSVSYYIYTGEANLELPFSFLALETGIKYSDIVNKSDISYLYKEEDSFVADPLRSNRFNYNERNVAGYVSAKKSLNKWFTLQAGLRYEHSYIIGVTPGNEKVDIHTDYGKFFPTVYLSYKPNSSHNFNFNYSRRINRPFFRALNPFKWYTNPNNVDQGNPALQPSFADNIEFSYILNGNLSFTAYYQKENDAYGQILYVEKNNTTFSTYKNMYNNRQLGMNVSYSFNPFRWWNIYLVGNYVYNKSDIKDDDFVAQSGNSFDFKCNNVISFDKAKHFQLYMNYSYNGPYHKGMNYDKSYANFNAGLKCAFFDNNLVLNIYANDVFKQDLVRRTTTAVTNVQHYHNYYDSRYLRVSLLYKWGNKKIKTQKKTISFDEQNRL